MLTSLFTVQDAVMALADWSGTSTGDVMAVRKIRRAIDTAYRDITNCRAWSYYMQRGRLDTVASQSSSTITYTNSTRAVDLASGTWPSWAAFGTIAISGVEYPVASAPSSTQLILSVNSNPGADVAAGASYVLWRDTYPCPVDFVGVGQIHNASDGTVLSYIEPNEWVAMRLAQSASSTPYYYTITNDPHYVGANALRLYPAPSSIYHYDYMYHRRPRPFTVPQYTTGTITSSGTTVTGVGTVFTSSMVGCVIRNSSTSTTAPTGLEGSNPYVEQRIISGYTSGTSLTVDQAFDATISSAAKFEISDPIDLDAGAMYSAFLRKCEMELGIQQRRQDTPALNQIYYMALQSALEADNRVLDRKPEGTRYTRRVPVYFDIVNDTT